MVLTPSTGYTEDALVEQPAIKLLLPKLISGEVDVSKLDILIPEEAEA